MGRICATEADRRQVLMSTITILKLLLFGLLATFVVRLARNIWAASRCYHREREWEALAKKGDRTAKVILQLREKPLSLRKPERAHY